MKFRIGDKVLTKPRNSSNSSPSAHKFAGRIVTIKDIHNREKDRDGFASLVEEGTYDGGVWLDELVLADKKEFENRSGKNDKIYLQNLINKANEGRRALEELFRIVPKKIEIKDEEDKKWRPLNSIKFLDYRLKVKPEMTPFKTVSGWSVSVSADKIHIGCKTFNQSDLLLGLTTLIEDNASAFECCGDNTPATLKLYSSKQGVIYETYLLKWVDAEKIATELKKLRED